MGCSPVLTQVSSKECCMDPKPPSQIDPKWWNLVFPVGFEVRKAVCAQIRALWFVYLTDTTQGVEWEISSRVELPGAQVSHHHPETSVPCARFSSAGPGAPGRSQTVKAAGPVPSADVISPCSLERLAACAWGREQAGSRGAGVFPGWSSWWIFQAHLHSYVPIYACAGWLHIS